MSDIILFQTFDLLSLTPKFQDNKKNGKKGN